ncbi:MAG: CDP-alcohol phosphatidyltransferase family protein [Simkaniaceae bacterium]|nr:CDP-alcohol phosphatidyltransferase family protein [Simkaniaceae bacterium]
MLNPPNALSFLRGPLALLFLFENAFLRCTALLLAMVTDFVDGYLARKYKYVSRLGAILDPLMDKFFIYVVLLILIGEGKLFVWQACLMLSRDFFLCLFGLYLTLTSGWKSWQFRSVISGKISTVMQFGTVIFLVLGIMLPLKFYWTFALVGVLVFIELIFTARPKTVCSETK